MTDREQVYNSSTKWKKNRLRRIEISECGEICMQNTTSRFEILFWKLKNQNRDYVEKGVKTYQISMADMFK